MAFAVEPYIFDWIFFDDSSLSKLGGFNLREERQQDVHARLHILTSDIGSVCAYIIRRGRLCCLFLRVGSQGLDEG